MAESYLYTHRWKIDEVAQWKCISVKYFPNHNSYFDVDYFLICTLHIKMKYKFIITIIIKFEWKEGIYF